MSDCGSNGVQGFILGFAVGASDDARGFTGLPSNVLHVVLDVHVFPSRFEPKLDYSHRSKNFVEPLVKIKLSC